ncbi:MAG: class I SAM-dependent methyltransferase [Sulfuricaulis sp.]
MNRKTHWDSVYVNKKPDEVSWYQTHLEKSLELIHRTGASQTARIIDLGGGASTLVDDLLASGFTELTVLDISATAIRAAQTRLGVRAQDVTWLESDVTRAVLPPHHYDIWHDRAVFHFLTNADDRRRYVEIVNHALKPGGHIIVATFGSDGPLQCSGLDIVRYDPEKLHNEFGDDFELIDSLHEPHHTPAGKTQDFIYCYCKKNPVRPSLAFRQHG